MKSFLRQFHLLLLAASFTACAPMRFSAYTGNDASSYFGTWPIGSGTMAEGAHAGGLFSSGLAVPIYRGWPERDYQVLGSIRFEDPNKNWGYDDGLLKAAATEAQQHGANAIIIRQGAEFGISQIAGARNNPFSVLSTFQTTALAIRWLSQDEIEKRRGLLNEYGRRFAEHFQSNPAIAVNRTVPALVFTYLHVMGQDQTQDFYDTFAETMGKLAPDNSESLAGAWIFKSTASLSTALSENEGRNSLGLATVSVDGESLIIVSSNGQAELNFNGTMVKGRLSGQLGIGPVSAKCEGAAAPEKISISFQSLTSDGTLSGNVVLQRLPAKFKK